MILSEFLRLYPMRAPNIMWFLGAGASASAGIPTAYNMIWDFKRSLYCSTQRVPLSACSDISNPLVRSRIQHYFDSMGSAPKEDDPEEYSYYFEEAYPHEADRRKYIDQLVSKASPSFGHLSLAALLKMDRARVIWTTNFDRMVEDASVTAFGNSGRLVTATIDAPNLASEAFQEGRWPLQVKLHGDYHSRRLKNTTTELRAQEADLRQLLLTACRSMGLAVVGYSGRDSSVVEPLQEAVTSGRGFPAGLFWFHRPDSPCLPAVRSLIESAAFRGIDAHLVEVETFDELLGDILSLVPNIPSEVQQFIENRPRRLSTAPLPTEVGSWPILRTNAFPLISAPNVCRRIVCDIGGTAEVRQAISKAGVAVIAARRSVGVIAFGDDAAIRTAFQPFNISEFSVHSIEQRRLQYDSAELGLLYDALCAAVARCRPVLLHRRGRRVMIAADPSRLSDTRYSKLRAAVSTISGTVPGTELGWSEAARIRLESRFGRLWILVLPTIRVEDFEDSSLADTVKEFIRARLAGRYNATWNSVLDGWTDLLLGGSQPCELRAFGTGNGLDAVFQVGPTTGFSWRGGVR